MKLHRINALLIRHLYLYKRSLPRMMDVVFWPVMEILLWGFFSLYLEQIGLVGWNVMTFLLGAIIFWDLLNQSQKAISIGFLEEVWERNLLNIFVTPLRISEFVAATALLGIIRLLCVASVLFALAFALYHFNLFMLGFALIPLAFNLFMFGWVLGLFTTAIILRYGSSAQILAWGFIALVQPFSAVFYPVSALPEALQYIAYLIPSTYVFEGMRAVLSGAVFPLSQLLFAFGMNTIYFIAVIWFFYRMFAYVKREGKLLKLEG